MIKKIVTILMLTVCLSACHGPSCIDADDFGFAKYVISARYNDNQLSQITNNNQIASWLDTGLVTNGLPLTIVVKTWGYGIDPNDPVNLSAWCPWYGGSNNTNTLAAVCERLQDCDFGGTMCSPGSTDATIVSAPCLMRNGIGLYALVAKNGANPNISLSSQQNPQGLNFHLGDPQMGYTLYDINNSGLIRPAGGLVYQYSDAATSSNSSNSQSSGSYVSNKLYFKILDKYYGDNSGQYQITIKSGVGDSSATDPVLYITSLVTDKLFGNDQSKGLIQGIYQGVIDNTQYRTAIGALLLIYLIYSVLAFLVGNINITQAELIIRISKIAIVSTLLSSEYSWKFFNEYLFVYFVVGVQEIISLVAQAGATGPGSSSLLGLMIAPQTLSKLLALLFMSWQGIIFIILFLIALYLVVITTFRATVLYLTALLTVGLLITMAPIFICFMLFETTRSLFDNWLKQLISYALQPILLFVGLAFMSIIIRTEIYSTLGFRVCKHDFPNLGPISQIFGSFTQSIDPALNNSIFYWWFPSPMLGEAFTRTEAVIPVPNAHYQIPGDTSSIYCQPYGCNENRYIELPFLDPVYDQHLINNFMQGNFLQYDQLLIIFMALYLLSKFNDISVSLSKYLTSTFDNRVKTQSIASTAGAPIELKINQSINYAKDQISSARTKIYGTIYSGINRLASSPQAQAPTLDPINGLVQANSGLTAQNMKPQANDEYNKALRQVISSVNPKLANISADDINSLANKNRIELKNELASILANKTGSDLKPNYNDLQDYDKRKIDQALAGNFNGKTFNELMNDNLYAKNYNKKYIATEKRRNIEDDFAEKTKYLLSSREDIKTNIRAESIAELVIKGEVMQANTLRTRSDQTIIANLSKDTLSNLGDKIYYISDDLKSKQALDEINIARKSAIKDDDLLNNRNYYDNQQTKAAKVIDDNYNMVSNFYNKPDLKYNEFSKLLNKYYQDKPSVQAYKSYTDAIQSYNKAGIVLNEMNKREEIINKQFGKFADIVNKGRENVELPKYEADSITSVRKLRTIEDRYRK